MSIMIGISKIIIYLYSKFFIILFIYHTGIEFLLIIYKKHLNNTI